MGEIEIDRFSDLPELVIDHILSYLGENDIIRLTSLCKKFRQICLTGLVLDFKHSCWRGLDSCICSDFSNSITNILSRRNGERVQRLRINWEDGLSCRYSEQEVDLLWESWFRYAVDCQVQELDLSLNEYGERRVMLFPNVEGVKELKLNLPRKLISLPQTIFTCLVSLTLVGVEIAKATPDGTFGECFNKNFVNVKMLCLQNVEGIPKISISSSSLEKFIISQWGMLDEGPYTLNVDSPSIKEIVISNCIFDHPTNLNISCSCLKTLTISCCQLCSSCEFVVSAKRLESLGLYIAFTLQEHEDVHDLEAKPPILRFMEELLFLKYAFVRIQALVNSEVFIRNYDSSTVLEDENRLSMEPDLRKNLRSPLGWLCWLEHLRYTTKLEIHFLPELFRYDCKSVNFCNLQQLVVSFVRFGGDEDLTVSAFLKLRVLVHLRTLTLKLDENSIPVCDTNVLYFMCLRAANYVVNGGAAKRVVFSLEDNDLEIDPEEDNSGLLEEILSSESALLSVTFIFKE